MPHVKKAVRWNSSFVVVEGMGWFASMHVFTRHVKVTFMGGGVGGAVSAGGEGAGKAVGEYTGGWSGRGADGGVGAAVGGFAGVGWVLMEEQRCADAWRGKKPDPSDGSASYSVVEANHPISWVSRRQVCDATAGHVA